MVGVGRGGGQEGMVAVGNGEEEGVIGVGMGEEGMVVVGKRKGMKLIVWSLAEWWRGGEVGILNRKTYYRKSSQVIQLFLPFIPLF
jgi:hypothetical protein